MTLPNWMRNALYATAAMNIGATALFLPPSGALRALAGMPEPGHPVYSLTAGIFVLLFGIGYLWTARAGRADPLFIALAAAGKLAFVMLVFWLWSDGALPARAVVAGSADLPFAIMFAKWLYDVRAAAPAGANVVRVKARS